MPDTQRFERRRLLGLLGGAAACAVMAPLPGLPAAAAPAPRMATRRIPASGQEVPVIGMGSADTFDVDAGGYPPLLEVLRGLVAGGASVVDTSPMYGRAEAALGSLVAEPEAEARLLPFCRAHGIAVIVNRPFADGALFARVKGKPLPPWAAELGCASWGQFFLRYVASHPAVTCVIPPTSRPQHVVDNCAAGRAPLPDEGQRRRTAEYWASV
jgi:diketogulonate reductase-like aldo/keto reductase